MTDKRDEALKLALEALEVATTPLAKDRQEVLRAITAIREALADHIVDANKMVEQPTCKQNLQVWVISNGKGRGQFSWEPQDERYWTRMEPAQQQSAERVEPLAYDKTEINCFAQDLYDQKMREGKRGHYESMFHVIHQCIKKVSPPASK